MWIHNFKYALKVLFRNKMLIFWTFAFPIILGTFFHMAFSNIENSEKLEVIPIAIVQNEVFENNEIFKQTFAQLSDEKQADRLFETCYVNSKEARDLLEDNKISGYIEMTPEETKVIVKENGINETILKYTTEEIIQTKQMVEDIAAKQITEQLTNGEQRIDYEALYQNILEKVQEETGNLKDVSREHLSYTMIEFYTLIAMTCLYGGTLGMAAINQNLANMSHNGKRVAVSPVSKGKLVISSAIASYITQVLGIALLFIYTLLVLKVDYGNHLGLVILLALCGCLAGLSIGIVVASSLKTNENVKTGIIISVSMLGSFLSGMMGITMKYIIDKNMPILNQINPASMITDGFYTLYYYDSLQRYWTNVIGLLLFTAILLGISIYSLRRQKYDSI
ncbi:MAG: ABC transporter permease [Clostridia bacterium]